MGSIMQGVAEALIEFAALFGMEDIVIGIFQAIELILGLDPEVIQITALSLSITFSAVIIASCIAIPLGAVVVYNDFRGKEMFISIIQTLYAIPTVVIGLVVFMLLSRSGPFGELNLLFAPHGMVIGQTILIFPIIIGMTISALKNLDSTLIDTIRSLGASKLQFLGTVFKEARFAIFAAIALAFGRAISEVGAAIIIGGNIRGKTRILTTAISLETGKGNIPLSIALGIILLLIALTVNMLMTTVQQR